MERKELRHDRHTVSLLIDEAEAKKGGEKNKFNKKSERRIRIKSIIRISIVFFMFVLIICLTISQVSAYGIPCIVDWTPTWCYLTKEDAQENVPTDIKNCGHGKCFVWDDTGRTFYRWRVIPTLRGGGCAHWVAHKLNIKHGDKSCYRGYSIRISDITAGRTKIEDIRCCKVRDIWTSTSNGHAGIVFQVYPENEEVEVWSCSSKYSGVGKDNYSVGTCWRDGPCSNDACGDNAHCSLDGTTCICKCDDDYEDCDGDWSNGCEVDLSTDSKNCGSCGNACANPHCSGSFIITDECINGKCVEKIVDCDEYDLFRCENDVVVFYDYYCDNGSCLSERKIVENCGAGGGYCLYGIPKCYCWYPPHIPSNIHVPDSSIIPKIPKVP